LQVVLHEKTPHGKIGKVSSVRFGRGSGFCKAHRRLLRKSRPVQRSGLSHFGDAGFATAKSPANSFGPARPGLDAAADGTGWRGRALPTPLPRLPFNAYFWANRSTCDFGPSRPFDQRALNYNILQWQENIFELTFPIFPCGVLTQVD